MNPKDPQAELRKKLRRVFIGRTHKFPDKKVEIIQPPETRNQRFIIAPYEQVLDKLTALFQAHQQELDLPTKQLVKTMVNDLETITYYKHHYVRKTGLKRQIKALLAVQRQQLLSDLLDYGSWLKDGCDLHEKYTSACCGCQRARQGLFEVENYKGYIERKIGELNG